MRLFILGIFVMLCNNAQAIHVPDGVYSAPLMPMRQDFACDLETFANHCASLIQRGCNGVVLFGTTGEGPSLALSERIDILNGLISKGFDPKKIIVSNGSSCLLDTIALGREAVKHGCLAFLVCPPSFYKNISDAGVVTFYREVIENIGEPRLPIILYHIPQYSGVPISIPVIEALRTEFPDTVIGIKESTGDLSFAKALLTTFPHFKVFVANECQIIELVSLGAAGAICGIPNLYPELIRSLYDCGRGGSVCNQEKIEGIFSALKGLPFIPAAKAVMESWEGPQWHSVRPPLEPLNREQAAQLIGSLQSIDQPVQAVLFDCDGTLVDSEYAHYLGWQHALTHLGHDLSLDEYGEYAGKSGQAISRQLAQKIGRDESHFILQKKREYFERLCEEGLPPISPTVQFLVNLAEQKETLGIKIGVCSAARKKEVQIHLRHLQIEHLVDVVLSGQEDLLDYSDPEGVNKPKPYIYLHAMKKLGAQPKNTVVIEDSVTGAMAGVAAGCLTIAIPNEHTKSHDFKDVHWKLDSLTGIDVPQFLQIVSKLLRDVE